jgi:protein SCO1/2
MKRFAILCGLLAACILPAAQAHDPSAHADVNLKAGTFDPPRAAPEIALPGADGKPFSLAHQRGKVVVLEFGYATCRDVCPVSLAMLASAHARLGPLAERMQVVFVTVDPERDTPQVLREYLANFDRSFIGITGTPAQLEAIRKAYGITATKKMQAGGSYTMGHSSYLYFIDPQGRLRALQPFGRPADDVVHDVKALLAP